MVFDEYPNIPQLESRIAPKGNNSPTPAYSFCKELRDKLQLLWDQNDFENFYDLYKAAIVILKGDYRYAIAKIFEKKMEVAQAIMDERISRQKDILLSLNRT